MEDTRNMAEQSPADDELAHVYCQYLTIPLLNIDKRVDLSTGALIHLSAEDFKILDLDYCHEAHFERTRPVFWHVASIFATEQQMNEAIKDEGADHPKLALLHNAMLCATGLSFPDPLVSTRYALKGRVDVRHIQDGTVYPRHVQKTRGFKNRGVTGRLFLLNAQTDEILSNEEIKCFAKLFEKWDKAGLSSDQPLFRAIRTLGIWDIKDNDLEFGSALVCAVVALEGLLLKTPTEKIVKTIEAKLNDLIPVGMNIDTHCIIRLAYKYRSEVIHGRLKGLPHGIKNLEKYTELWHGLLRIICAVTIILADRIIANDTSSVKV